MAGAKRATVKFFRRGTAKGRPTDGVRCSATNGFRKFTVFQLEAVPLVVMRAAADRAERRACFAQNKQRMQHSSLSCHAVGPAPPATSSRHQGRQMAPANPAQGTRQRLPAYNLGDHDASLEVHSQAIDGSRRDHAVDRRVSEAWKERLRKEQRAHSSALLAQAAADHPPCPASERAAPAPDPLQRLRRLAQAPDPAPRPASERTPRGPDHLRHVGGQTSAPLPPSREEALRRLRKHGHAGPRELRDEAARAVNAGLGQYNHGRKEFTGAGRTPLYFTAKA